MPSSNAWVESLGWMLIHSVWLIAVVVGISAVGLRLLRQRRGDKAARRAGAIGSVARA